MQHHQQRNPQQDQYNQQHQQLQQQQQQQQQVTVFNQYNSGTGNTQYAYGKPIDDVAHLQMSGNSSNQPINVVQEIQGSTSNPNGTDGLQGIPVQFPMQFQVNPAHKSGPFQASGTCTDKTLQIQTSYHVQGSSAQLQATCQVQRNCPQMENSVINPKHTGTTVRDEERNRQIGRCEGQTNQSTVSSQLMTTATSNSINRMMTTPAINHGPVILHQQQQQGQQHHQYQQEQIHNQQKEKQM